MVHNYNTYKGRYFSHGAEREKVRNCALDYKNELTKPSTSSESEENCELSDGAPITTRVVIYYLNFQKFGSQKMILRSYFITYLAQNHCFFVCSVIWQCKIYLGSNDSKNNVIFNQLKITINKHHLHDRSHDSNKRTSDTNYLP